MTDREERSPTRSLLYTQMSYQTWVGKGLCKRKNVCKIENRSDVKAANTFVTTLGAQLCAPSPALTAFSYTRLNSTVHPVALTMRYQTLETKQKQ